MACDTRMAGDAACCSVADTRDSRLVVLLHLRTVQYCTTYKSTVHTVLPSRFSGCQLVTHVTNIEIETFDFGYRVPGQF
jgi:hypothetical protein